MQTSRIVRTALVSTVLGLGAVTAVASTAGAATHTPAPTHASSAAGVQDTHLSDGTVAHVSHLHDGHWQAWITKKGARIAALDAKHPSKKVHGFTYVLNQANGFVGVVHPGGWHSEQDKPAGK